MDEHVQRIEENRLLGYKYSTGHHKKEDTYSSFIGIVSFLLPTYEEQHIPSHSKNNCIVFFILICKKRNLFIFFLLSRFLRQRFSYLIIKFQLRMMSFFFFLFYFLSSSVLQPLLFFFTFFPGIYDVNQGFDVLFPQSTPDKQRRQKSKAQFKRTYYAKYFRPAVSQSQKAKVKNTKYIRKKEQFIIQTNLQ